MTATADTAPGTGRRLRRILLILVAVPIAAAFLLQVPAVRTGVVNRMLAKVDVWQGMTLRADNTAGSVLWTLGVSDVELRRADGSVAARADGIEARWSPLALLAGRVRIRHLEIRSPQLLALRDSAGTIDLLAPFLEPADAPSPWSVSLDRLELTDGHIEVSTESGSTWQAGGIDFALSDLETAAQTRLRVDSLVADVRDPDERWPGRLVFAGALAGGDVSVDTLLFSTSRSRVTGAGSVRLPSPETPTTDRARLRLRAAPLSLADLAPLMAGLNESGEIHVDADVMGDGHAVTVSADGQLGASGRLDAHLTRIAGPDSAAWRGYLAVSGLAPGELFTDYDPDARISFRMESDLAGTTDSLLAGSTRFEATSAGLFGMADIDLNGSQQWSLGRAVTTVDGMISGTAVSATGWIRPIGHPEYVFDVRSDPVTPPGMAGVTAGAAGRIEGLGWPRHGNVHATWRLVEARSGNCTLDGVAGSVRKSGSRVWFGAAGSACGAFASMRGSVDLDRGSWTLDSLQTADLPIAALVGRDDTSRASLRARGSGRLTASGRPTGTVTADVLAARWNQWQLDSMRVRVTLGEDGWTADTRARAGQGALSGSLAGPIGSQTSGPPRATRIESLRLDSLDLATLSGGSLPATALSGEGSGEITQTDGLTGSLSLRLVDSRVGRQHIDEARGRLALRHGSGRVDLAVSFPGGSAEARADLVIGRDTVLAEIAEARFYGIDAAAWTGSAWETRLSGSADGWFATGPSNRSAALNITLAPNSSIRSADVASGSLSARLETDTLHVSLGLIPAGGGSMSALVQAGPDSTFAADVTADSVDVAALVASGPETSSVSARVHLRGHGVDPRTASGRVRARVTGRYGDVRLDSLIASSWLDDGRLAFDTLTAAGSFGSLRATGTLPLPGPRGSRDSPSDLSVTARLGDTAPVLALFGLEETGASGATVDIRLRNSRGGISVLGSAAIEGLNRSRLRVASLDATLTAEMDEDWALDASELRLEAETVSLPATTAERAEVLLTVAGDSVSVDGDVRIDPARRLRMIAATSRDLEHVSLEALDVLLDEASWSLLAPADIDLVDGFRISNLVLSDGERRISAGGGLGSQRNDLVVTVDRVDLTAVADLLGYRGLGLVVSGAIAGTGTGGDRQLSGFLEADVLTGGRPAARVEAAATLADRLLRIDGTARHQSGGEGAFRGIVSLAGEALAQAPVELEFSADSLAVGWLLPFMDRDLVSSLAGSVSGRVEVRGTFDSPELTGQARLRRGRLGLPTLGRPRNALVMTDVAADLLFDGETVTVERASMRSGGGQMRASGSVQLEQLTLGQFDLDLTSANFLAIDDGVFRAFVASDLALTGSTRRPVLSGTALVTRGDFRLTDERSADAFEPVELSADDLLALEQRFGLRVSAADTTTFSFYRALAIESLRLDFGRDVWLRSKSNPRMDVRFEGSLDVQKTRQQDPLVFGTITVMPEQSRIEQFGRRFAIERGELNFTGPMHEPDIDLAAGYTVRSRGTGAEEVVIRLVATGRPDDLRVEFDSDPAMELSDIVSYIATGRPASSSLQFDAGSGDSYLNTAAGLAIGPIAGMIEQVAGSELGLDVVEIEHNGLNGLTLTAGKYVSPEFYVSVRQPISFATATESTSADQQAETQVSMEYEIVRDLLMSLLTRGAVLRVQLRWDYAF